MSVPTEFYEGLTVGEVREFGERTVTKAEIVEFAERYAPQPFHVDEEAAEDSIFGELVASGIHVIAIVNRVVSDHFYSETAVLGGLRMDDVRFLRPVRPGDTLSVRLEIVEKRESETHDDRGLARVRTTGINQHDERVLDMSVLGIYARGTRGQGDPAVSDPG